METKGRKLNSHRGGFALAMVMSVIVLLLLLGWGVTSLGLQGQIFAIRTTTQIKARVAADAGLTKALSEMNQLLLKSPFGVDSSLPSVTDEALPHCDATYTYAVVGDTASGYNIQSVGRAGTEQRIVNAALRYRGIFDIGLIVKEKAVLYSGSLVDGYYSNSSITDVYVQVASVNPDPGSVRLMPGASVDGEILYGYNFDFPEVAPPALLPVYGSDIEAQGGIVKLTPAESGVYKDLSLKQDTVTTGGTTTSVPGNLIIEGGHVDLHITDDVWLGNSCEITITPGSSLSIFVEGDFITGNTSSINNETQVPASFGLYGIGTEQKFELKAKGDWYGTVYAPEADVTIKASGDMYGSFVANTFYTHSSGTVWYDAALSDINPDDLGVRFVIDRWSEQ